MSFLEFPIRRYQFTLIAFAMLVALGITSFSSIPRQEDPYFPISMFQIIDRLSRRRAAGRRAPGRQADRGSPERAGRRQEDRVAQQRRRRDDHCRSSTRTSTPEKKYDEVVREINALRPTLPRRADASSRSARSIPASSTSCSSRWCREDAPYRELEDHARDLKDTLKTRRRRTHVRDLGVSGARAARRARPAAHGRAESGAGARDAGAAEREHEHSRRLDRRRQPQLQPARPPAATRRSMKCATPSSPSVDGRTRARPRHRRGELGHAGAHYIGRYNGKRAVFVTANQKDGYNIFEVRERIVAAAERFEAQLPKRIKLERGFDQSENVATRLEPADDGLRRSPSRWSRSRCCRSGCAPPAS